MTDEDVADLLDSDTPLIVVEAPAGCGKTYQGAHYALRATAQISAGRVLILTHTHAACAAFAEATRTAHRRIEIRTLDSLIVQIAAAYHKSLDLPPDPAAWARREGGNAYAALAAHVGGLIKRRPFVAAALAARFPIVIADEHQDTSADQHGVLMALHESGAKLRIFGDPMQGIYARGKAAEHALTRWEETKTVGAYAELETPHRWREGTPALGRWVLEAREALKGGQPINLTGTLPQGLKLLYADNNAAARGFYRISKAERAPIDAVTRTNGEILILTPQNEMTGALAAFWNRSIPIWEGHTRQALDRLVAESDIAAGDPVALAQAFIDFMGSVATGFSPSSHGNRFLQEVNEGCARTARGKPANIQQLARLLLDEPTHRGLAKCLARLSEFRRNGTPGFEAINIVYRQEYQDAMRLGEFANPHDALAELGRRRSFAHPVPPPRAISTIHKAKGLQCDNALVMPCDGRFSASLYSRCRLYVAISRAKRSLTLVVSRNNPSPLLIV